jgi:hypothetical protein
MKTIAILCLAPMCAFGGAFVVSHGGGQVSPTPGFQLFSAQQMAQEQAARQNQIEEAQAAQQRQALIVAALNRDPWRIVNGRTNHITAHWVRFSGQVLQITRDGIRVHGDYSNLDGSQETVLSGADQEYFVKNFPYELADSESFGSGEVFLALPAGVYSYTTVMGANKTIRSLDYCPVCAGPEIKPPSRAEILAVQAAANAKKKAAEDKTLKWNEDQAAAGDAYGEQRMGERYRDGDGVQKDINQARAMFEKASAQGNKEASSELKDLSQ